MKYKIEVGSLVTRYAQKTIVVSANSETEAEHKAKEIFTKREMELACAVDAGSPQINSVVLLRGVS